VALFDDQAQTTVELTVKAVSDVDLNFNNFSKIPKPLQISAVSPSAKKNS